MNKNSFDLTNEKNYVIIACVNSKGGYLCITITQIFQSRILLFNSYL